MITDRCTHSPSAALALCLNLAQHLNGFMKICLKILPHQIEDFDENLVPERIENLVTLLTAADDLPAPQDRQMLRNVGLLNAQPFLNGAGRQLTFTQNLQYGDSCGMCECLEDTGLVLPQHVRHGFIIFDYTNILKYPSTTLKDVAPGMFVLVLAGVAGRLNTTTLKDVAPGMFVHYPYRATLPFLLL